MPRHRSPYPEEFREQIVALVRSGRAPDELAKEFEPSAQLIPVPRSSHPSQGQASRSPRSTTSPPHPPLSRHTPPNPALTRVPGRLLRRVWVPIIRRWGACH